MSNSYYYIVAVLSGFGLMTAGAQTTNDKHLNQGLWRRRQWGVNIHGLIAIIYFLNFYLGLGDHE